jgi:probable rRNA maturation factor
MMWEGLYALPFVLEKKVIVLEHRLPAVRVRALSLFAAKAQRALGLSGEVNVRITSNRELQDLNRRFRRKNKPTDVLSFPSDLPKLAGDIAISAEIAAANAADMGHSTEAELRILILHGLLHLAGYDHETDNGAMQARETKLRQQLGLPTGLIERTHSNIRPRRTGKVIRRSAPHPGQGSRK